MLDDERRSRLRRAGERFRNAQHEQSAAVSELKQALAAADGDSSPQEASDLTGLSPVESEILLEGD